MLTKHKTVFAFIALFVCFTVFAFILIFTKYVNTRNPVVVRTIGNRTVEFRGKYTVLKNFIKGDLQPKEWNASVTYATHGSPEFLYHLVELIDRWDSFISLSVYAPGSDFHLAITFVDQLRKCYPRVRQLVNWHFIYDTEHSPPNFTLFDAIQSSHMINVVSCNCTVPLALCASILQTEANFRCNHSLPYPINVLRNVARSASKTKYVLLSDIELYPSSDLVPAFLDLVTRENNGQVPTINPTARHVYMLPIFEVKSSVEAPRNKSRLIDQFNHGDAIFFHHFVCDECQKFPNRQSWIKQSPSNESNLNVFGVTKRTGSLRIWEPIFIGTNEEPYYDEQLTWEGKLDKMSQMYEMCLMDYDIVILDNAFLVHAPGIKYPSAKEDAKREPYEVVNRKRHNKILWTLKFAYGFTSKCD